jgi:GAF domain-containing protein
MPATPDSALADPRRSKADLQRELAELRRTLDEALHERDEALAQQAATAEVLGVINSSSGDLAPVLDAMLERATRLCEAGHGHIWRYDSEVFQPATAYGTPEFVEWFKQRGPVRPNLDDGDNFLGRIVRGERVLYIADVRETNAYRAGNTQVRALVELSDGRSVITVALRREDRLVGAMTVYRQEVRPFTDKQVALLQNFAAQAVIAMENARLITETREALEQQTATAEVLGVINSSPGDLAPVFDAILEKAHGLCGAAFGALWTYDGEHFDAVDLRRVPPGLAEFLSRRPFPTAAGSVHDRLLSGERVVHIDDVAAQPLIGSARRALVEDGGARTLVAVPLRSDDRLLGAITAYRQEVRPFTEKQIALLQNFAAQAVIAMENARLITETREALEQQTTTAEVLEIINSSPGVLQPVFDAMLERAIRFCEGIQGSLWTFDGEHMLLAASRGLTPEFIAVARDLRERGDPGEHDPVRRILRGERLIKVLDASVDRSHGKVVAAATEIGGARARIFVALVKDTTPVGAFVVSRRELRPFTDRQIALLQNFAAQAVVAMENARLLTETREALDQQTATAEVLGVINSSPGDLSPVFEAMLEKASRLCEAAFGIMNIWDGERFQRVAMRGLPPEVVDVFREPMVPPPGSLAERFVRGETVVRIPDLSRDEIHLKGPGLQALVRFGARSYAAVALRKEDHFLGSFMVYRTEVRPFSDKQIALLQNFAAQAVIAMENARLITETREALEQQTATAEVLGVINSSPSDLTPVFEAILENAHRLCGAVLGTLTIREGDQFRTVAMHGVPEPFAALLRRPFSAAPGGGVDRLLQGERIVHIADVAKHGIDNPVRSAAIQAGVRTLLFVPLRKDGSLLGHITAHREEVRPFSEKQIALLENFAAQAVIAMENARLISETKEALEQQTATAEVLGVINSSPGDLAPVFDAILEKAHILCQAAHGHLTIYDGDLFRIVAMHGIDAVAPSLTQPFRAEPGSLQERLLRGERLIHIPDIDIDATAPKNVRRQIAIEAGFHTVIFVPLRKDEVLVGYITAYRKEVRPFTDKQIGLLQNFAAQAVIAMENARLLGELRDRNEEIAGWNRELEVRVAAQLAELERTGKLRRFLAPQLADLIIAHGDESILESHRREIVVVFCDIRGFTAFAERAEPEEVMALLRDYHAALGPIVARYEGTLDHYSGDGVMVFFNDPLPTPEPAKRAIEMAAAMREAAQQVLKTWRRHGHDLGFGVGISQGYATLGQIGFAERMDYTAIGTVCNLAARLCDEAKDGQILISRRVAIAVEEDAKLEEIGEVSLKGLSQAVAVYNVVQ